MQGDGGSWQYNKLGAKLKAQHQTSKRMDLMAQQPGKHLAAVEQLACQQAFLAAAGLLATPHQLSVSFSVR